MQTIGKVKAPREQIEGGYSTKVTGFLRDLDGLSRDGYGSEGIIQLLLEELKLSVEMLSAQDRLITQLREELKQEREKTERASARYDDLITYNPTGCLLTDMNGKILQTNREAASLLGMDEKGVVGKLLVLFLHEEERRNFNAQIQGRFRVSRRLQYKSRLQPENGSPREVSFTVSAVNNDPSGGAPTLMWLIHPARTDANGTGGLP